MLTFLQDIKVFGINEVFESEAASGDKKVAGARTVELLLTPKQAQAVTLASELGKIRLSLRGLEIDDSPPPTGTDSAQLLDTPDKADRNKEAGLSALADTIRKKFAQPSQVKPLPPPADPGTAPGHKHKPQPKCCQTVRQLEHDADRRPRTSAI